MGHPPETALMVFVVCDPEGRPMNSCYESEDQAKHVARNIERRTGRGYHVRKFVESVEVE